MKQQHTPGPWHHDEYGHICAGPQIIGKAYQFELDDSDHDELPCIPNARLLAAAPELLTALRACCVMMVNVRGLKENHYQEWIDRFKLIEKNSAKLIKKIEGDEGED